MGDLDVPTGKFWLYTWGMVLTTILLICLMLLLNGLDEGYRKERLIATGHTPFELSCSGGVASTNTHNYELCKAWIQSNRGR